MRWAWLVCLMLATSAHAQTSELKVTWDAPTTNEDGSTLTDLSHYIVRWGKTSEVYDNEARVDHPTTEYIITRLIAGTRYFATVIAVDLAGNTSGMTAEMPNPEASEIAPGDVEAPPPGPPSDLLVHLPFDRDDFGTAKNYGTSGIDGAVTGAGRILAGTRPGRARQFDGVDDWIDLGHTSLTGSEITVSCWFMLRELPTAIHDARLISKASGPSNADHVLMLSTITVPGGSQTNSSDLRVRGRLKVAGTTMELRAPSGLLAATAWYHVALTYDGAAIKLYLDGAEVGSMPATGEVTDLSDLRLAVGAQPPGAGGKHLDGQIDDVRIYRRALTANQVAGLMIDTEPPSAGTVEIKSVEAQ